MEAIGFDTLVTADLMTADVDATAQRVVAALGSPMWRDSWIHDYAHHKFRANFLRMNLDRTNAPTTVEVIGPHPTGVMNGMLQMAWDLQGDRPMKTHSTVFSVADVETVRARLESLHIPYLFNTGVGSPNPFPKLWIGQQRSDTESSDYEPEVDPPLSYDPTFDGGLMAEIVPTWAMKIPPERKNGGQPAPGCPVRVAARSFVVDDLDAVITTLQRTLGWTPTSKGDSAQDAAKFAEYRGAMPSSSTLELLQPDGPGVAADYHRCYGPGAYRITIAVNGLAGAAQRLTERGITHRALQATDDEPGRIAIEPDAIGGLYFDLVDA